MRLCVICVPGRMIVNGIIKPVAEIHSIDEI
jgi:hypothetical protein